MEYVYEMLKRQENNNFDHTDSKDVTIINGKVVKEAEYPHMGALGWWSAAEETKKLVFLCGASLISDRFMLTAAHCTYSTRRDLVQHEPYLVRLGSRYLEQSPHEIPKDVIISKLRCHPNYVPLHRFFDIALVELEKKVPFSKFIQPACLPSRRHYLSSGKKNTDSNWMGIRHSKKKRLRSFKST
nr:serine protease persephone-like [Maniola hyperantus]